METQIELATAKEMERKPDTFMTLLDRIQSMSPEAQGKVLDNYDRFLKIQAKQDYDAAMAELKHNMPAIIKSKVADMNGKYSYHYAELQRDVCEKLDPVLEAHGFGYRWTTRSNEKGVVMVCILWHVHGHQEETEMPPAPHDNSGGKNAVQAIGSTLSYMQRYSLLMALGIAPKNVDSDGHFTPAEVDFPGLDEYCTAISDAHNFEEMDKAFREGYTKASQLKSNKAKDALGKARDEWRKRKKEKAGAR